MERGNQLRLIYNNQDHRVYRRDIGRPTSQNLPGASKSSAGIGCLDFKNNTIREGDKFSISNDPCFTCTCLYGEANLCTSELCQPKLIGCTTPVKQVEGKCCEFECSTGNRLVTGQNNFESLDYSDRTASLSQTASLISCFIVFSVILYIMQTFRRQKLKSLLNDLQARQGRDSQLIVVDHSCARLMSGGLSHNFVPIVNNLITLEELHHDQFHYQTKENQTSGGLPPPPPPYSEERSNGESKPGDRIIEIGDAPTVDCVPSEGLEKS